MEPTDDSNAGSSFVSLKRVVELSACSGYQELQKLSQVLFREEDDDRKSRLIQYFSTYKNRFIQLLALLKFSENAESLNRVETSLNELTQKSNLFYFAANELSTFTNTILSSAGLPYIPFYDFFDPLVEFSSFYGIFSSINRERPIKKLSDEQLVLILEKKIKTYLLQSPHEFPPFDDVCIKNGFLVCQMNGTFTVYITSIAEDRPLSVHSVVFQEDFETKEATISELLISVNLLISRNHSKQLCEILAVYDFFNGYIATIILERFYYQLFVKSYLNTKLIDYAIGESLTLSYWATNYNYSYLLESKDVLEINNDTKLYHLHELTVGNAASLILTCTPKYIKIKHSPPLDGIEEEMFLHRDMPDISGILKHCIDRRSLERVRTLKEKFDELKLNVECTISCESVLFLKVSDMSAKNSFDISVNNSTGFFKIHDQDVLDAVTNIYYFFDNFYDKSEPICARNQLSVALSKVACILFANASFLLKLKSCLWQFNCLWRKQADGGCYLAVLLKSSKHNIEIFERESDILVKVLSFDMKNEDKPAIIFSLHKECVLQCHYMQNLVRYLEVSLNQSILRQKMKNIDQPEIVTITPNMFKLTITDLKILLGDISNNNPILPYIIKAEVFTEPSLKNGETERLQVGTTTLRMRIFHNSDLFKAFDLVPLDPKRRKIVSGFKSDSRVYCTTELIACYSKNISASFSMEDVCIVLEDHLRMFLEILKVKCKISLYSESVSRIYFDFKKITVFMGQYLYTAVFGRENYQVYGAIMQQQFLAINKALKDYKNMSISDAILAMESMISLTNQFALRDSDLILFDKNVRCFTSRLYILPTFEEFLLLLDGSYVFNISMTKDNSFILKDVGGKLAYALKGPENIRLKRFELMQDTSSSFGTLSEGLKMTDKSLHAFLKSYSTRISSLNLKFEYIDILFSGQLKRHVLKGNKIFFPHFHMEIYRTASWPFLGAHAECTEQNPTFSKENLRLLESYFIYLMSRGKVNTGTLDLFFLIMFNSENLIKEITPLIQLECSSENRNLWKLQMAPDVPLYLRNIHPFNTEMAGSWISITLKFENDKDKKSFFVVFDYDASKGVVNFPKLDYFLRLANSCSIQEAEAWFNKFNQIAVTYRSISKEMFEQLLKVLETPI